MEISVKTIKAILLNTGEGIKVTRNTTGIYLKYAGIWYIVDSRGIIDGQAWDQKWLYDILVESGGIYEQLELF